MEGDRGGEPSTSVESEKEKEVENKVGCEIETPGEGARPQVGIDKILEDSAHKKNLSVMNVKSILRVSHIEQARGGTAILDRR